MPIPPEQKGCVEKGCLQTLQLFSAIVRPHFPDFFPPCKCQVMLGEMKSSFRNAMQLAWVLNQSFQEIHTDVSRGEPS